MSEPTCEFMSFDSNGEPIDCPETPVICYQGDDEDKPVNRCARHADPNVLSLYKMARLTISDNDHAIHLTGPIAALAPRVTE